MYIYLYILSEREREKEKEKKHMQYVEAAKEIDRERLSIFHEQKQIEG
jgi:hypothetical protein